MKNIDIEKLSNKDLLGILTPKQTYSIVIVLISMIIGAFTFGSFIQTKVSSISESDISFVTDDFKEKDVSWEMKNVYYIDLVNDLTGASEKVEHFKQFSRAGLLDILIDSVREGKINAYDYNKLLNEEKKEKLSLSKVHNFYNSYMERHGIDEFTKDKVDKIKVIEEWNLDSKSMKIESKIIAISPAVKEYHSSGKLKGTGYSYWVLFE